MVHRTSLCYKVPLFLLSFLCFFSLFCFNGTFFPLAHAPEPIKPLAWPCLPSRSFFHISLIIISAITQYLHPLHNFLSSPLRNFLSLFPFLFLVRPNNLHSFLPSVPLFLCPFFVSLHLILLIFLSFFFRHSLSVSPCLFMASPFSLLLFLSLPCSSPHTAITKVILITHSLRRALLPFEFRNV